MKLPSRQMVNGEPLVIALDTPFMVVCCGCSLTHTFVLSSTGGKCVFLLRGYRDEFLTEIARRKRRRRKRDKKGSMASSTIDNPPAGD